MGLFSKWDRPPKWKPNTILKLNSSAVWREITDPGSDLAVASSRSVFHQPLWVFPTKEGKPPKWMVKIMENPIKMDDLGGFPPIFGNKHLKNMQPSNWIISPNKHENSKNLKKKPPPVLSFFRGDLAVKLRGPWHNNSPVSTFSIAIFWVRQTFPYIHLNEPGSINSL